jgi:hypothetical protein
MALAQTAAAAATNPAQGGATIRDPAASAAALTPSTTAATSPTAIVRATPSEAAGTSVSPTPADIVIALSTAMPVGALPDASTSAARAAAAATEVAAARTATPSAPAPAASPTTVVTVSAPAASPTTAATAVPPTVPPPAQVATEALTVTPPAQAAVSCDEPCAITFTELYSGAGITGPSLSEKAQAFSGHKVVMLGYMAPPLSPDTSFFVLSKTPLVYCPFCNTASDWPFDIVYVKMAGGHSIPTLVPTQGIRVIGTFEAGDWTDPETGFVSRVRLIADDVQVVQ